MSENHLQISQKSQEEQIQQESRLWKRRSQEGPRNVRKYRKSRKSNKDFFLRAKNTRDKYRKNGKNNKCNKILDLEKEETKKGPETSANIAKVTRIFLASSKNPWEISLVTFGNPCLKNYGYCTATFIYNATILWPVFFSPNVLFLIFWKDRYGGFLATKSSTTTPFYCLKFAPFCERHSFLCIVAVRWWKN